MTNFKKASVLILLTIYDYGLAFYLKLHDIFSENWNLSISTDR